MRSRALRVTLTLLAMVGMAAAAWYGWTLQRHIISIDDQGTAFVQARLSASRHASDLQSSQQAYVAAGQNEAFWFERVTAAGAALRKSIEEMESAAPSGSVRSELAGLTTAVDEFEDRDRRVRGYASAGQKLLAADVIFSDSLDAASRIHTSIERASETATAVRSAERQRLGLNQALAAAGAGGLAIVVMLLLVPAVPRSEVAPAVVPEPRATRAEVENDSLELRPTRAAESIRGPEPEAVAVQKVEAVEVPPVLAPTEPAVPRLELDSIARVCTDLARLDDTSAVPSILERMSAALDASGIVLWVTDAEHRELVPIAAHGYPANVLSRMKSLPLSIDNATTAAFKTGMLQTVSADGAMSGAIAAPLVSPGGCLGVMSAEVRHQGEKQPDRLAAATIVAAQLATIIGPPAARAEDRSTAAI